MWINLHARVQVLLSSGRSLTESKSHFGESPVLCYFACVLLSPSCARAWECDGSVCPGSVMVLCVQVGGIGFPRKLLIPHLQPLASLGCDPQ